MLGNDDDDENADDDLDVVQQDEGEGRPSRSGTSGRKASAGSAVCLNLNPCDFLFFI